MILMVDLETLGTGYLAPIVQIGAAKGTCVEDATSRVWNIDKEDWGALEADTVLWWMDQPYDVRAEVFRQDRAVTLVTALSELAAFARGCTEVWANSPNFDLRLLREHGINWHFTHRHERDFRTLRHMIGGAVSQPAHVADFDALLQLRDTFRFLDQLNKLKVR